MHFEVHGDSNNPNILVCVPGLMGGPSDFAGVLNVLERHFCIVIADHEAERRKQGFRLTESEVLQVTYNSVAEEVNAFLKENFKSVEKYYFLGLSLGGKIVYDFILRYPQNFAGVVVADVGLKSFEESIIYKITENTFNNLNLNQNWDAIKKDLQDQLPEKNLRILVKTQIVPPRPDQNLPAQWRPGMRFFKNIMDNQSIKDQYQDFINILPVLKTLNKKITILKAEFLSGISDDDFDRMQETKIFDFVSVRQASHFVWASHSLLLSEYVLKMHPQFAGQNPS